MTALSPGSGAFDYLLNDRPVDLTETFEVSGNDDCFRVNSQRRVAGSGTVLQVQAEIRSSFVVAATIILERENRTSYGEYAVQPDQISVRRWSGSPPGRRHVVPLSSPSFLFPLLRVFSGLMVDWLVSRGGSGHVMAPTLEGDRLLWPDATRRRATPVSTLWPGDAPPPATRCYELAGGPYLPAATYWVDALGQVIRYRWQQAPDQLWEVVRKPVNR